MNSPKLLILETSGRQGQVGLALGNHLIDQEVLDGGRQHARDLAPSVELLLRRQQWHPREIQGVIVGRGPGSFTGLRVGIISAMAYAYATDCALLAVDTFHTIAIQVPATCGQVAVLGDAQKQELYIQPFVHREGAWHPSGEIVILPFEAWLAQHAPQVWVTGPGLARWESQLPSTMLLIDPALRQPTLSATLDLGWTRYLREERDSLYSVEPLYLRASAAERQWSGRT
ncbi:MAG: tRNA (adenosine(37)-N6)-threonylcarbamoyltransferase complex dimerization subunit type 1 TsaB [Gemmataceae bacterium]